MILLLIVVFIIIILIEVPKLVKKKYWYELGIYFIFLSFAFILVVFQISGVKIPSPIKAMEYIVKNVLHLNYE